MTSTALRGIDRMTRSGLRGIWLRGDLPPGPFVWAANHHSWWDPFVAAGVLDAHDRRISLMMQQDNLGKFAFARRLGAFGTEEPRRGLSDLATGAVLVIFPEGRLRPAGALGDVSRGAPWYARRAGVPLCAVAVRVLVRGHQAPEAYVSCTLVDPPGSLQLHETLDCDLHQLDALAGNADPEAPLPGFRAIAPGRRDWNERIDTMTRWRPWRA